MINNSKIVNCKSYLNSYNNRRFEKVFYNLIMPIRRLGKRKRRSLNKDKEKKKSHPAVP